MFKTLQNRVKKSFAKHHSPYISFVLKIISGFAGIVAILAFFQSQNINLIQILGQFIQSISNLLGFRNVPLIMWIILIPLCVFLYWQKRKINLVAGEFNDSFENGLGNWEYDSEGWKIEQENKEAILSVSDSQDGGITKKGFSWTDYEFVFDTKVISKCSGWIIRAENRSKYLMIQLNLENLNKQMLRLHLKIPGSSYPWIVMPEVKLNLEKSLKLLEWIKVKIVVLGSNVDVYLNGEHAAHYLLQDPLPVSTDEQVQLVEDNGLTSNVKIKRSYVAMDYSVGRVGFRCAPLAEHAHFRNVRVNPIF